MVTVYIHCIFDLLIIGVSGFYGASIMGAVKLRGKLLYPAFSPAWSSSNADSNESVCASMNLSRS
jgi:hypothetical protein